MRNGLGRTAAMAVIIMLVAACGSDGGAAISSGEPEPGGAPTTAAGTVPKGRNLPAGEPRPACDLFNQGEVGEILGNPVRAGSGSARNCFWGTAVDKGTSAQLSVNTPGRARAAQECTIQRNSLNKELKQEPVEGVAASTFWGTQPLSLLLQGTMVACFEDAVVLVILTGERESAVLRDAAGNLARQTYLRL